jgi:hypothetical protein
MRCRHPTAFAPLEEFKVSYVFHVFNPMTCVPSQNRAHALQSKSQTTDNTCGWRIEEITPRSAVSA